MKRSPIRRRTPLRKVSPKTAARNRKRAAFRAAELASRPYCEAQGSIWTHDPSYNRCSMISVDLHEPLTRARGGDILDPKNTVALCRPCHDWIHNNPAAATDLGLLISAYEDDS